MGTKTLSLLTPIPLLRYSNVGKYEYILISKVLCTLFRIKFHYMLRIVFKNMLIAVLTCMS